MKLQLDEVCSYVRSTAEYEYGRRCGADERNNTSFTDIVVLTDPGLPNKD